MTSISDQPSECEGILACVTKATTNQADTDQNKKIDSVESKCLQFQRQNAHFLRRFPYYQCSLALCTDQKLQWFKYTSKGEIESSSQAQSTDAQGLDNQLDLKNDGGDDNDKNSDASSDQEQKRNEQMGLYDYGFKEKAYVLPQDDCFTKFFNDIDAPQGRLHCAQGTFSIFHTRFAEVNKFYSVDKGLSGIPDEHAHPSIDKKQRVAVFHHGVISNQNELWQHVKDTALPCEVNQGFKEPTEAQLIASLIGGELDKGASLKEAIVYVVERKILGTFRLAVMEVVKPKYIYFAKNVGDFIIGTSSDQGEVVVSSDPSVLSSPEMKQKYQQRHIQNNELCELNIETCEFAYTKLEKKINIGKYRKPKVTYNHIVHEEIEESIYAIDQATDFGGKFISDNRVVLGGFEKAQQELSQVKDLIIQGLGTSFHAAQYGAFIFKQLKIFNTVRVVSPRDVTPLLFKNVKNGGFLTVSRNGSDSGLVKAIKLAYQSELTCMNVINQENSPVTKAVDEVLRERKEQARDQERQRVVFNVDSDEDDENEEEFQDKNIGMYIKCGYCFTDLKSFIPQVVCLSMVALWYSHCKTSIQSSDMEYSLQEKKEIVEERKKIVADIGCLSLVLKHSLQSSFIEKYKEIAKFLKTQENLFLLSKGTGVYVSEFVAQKFNQMALIHAESYSSAEFRHGPLSMIDEQEKTAIIFLVLDDETITQVLSNILQVKERGATVIVLTNVPNIEKLIDCEKKIDFLIKLFEQKSIFAALCCTIPLLMICYHTALEKGVDPDQKVSDAINFRIEMNE